MTDIYLRTTNHDELTAFCAAFRDVIGPIQGRAAVEEQKTEGGEVIPAQEAVGDPDSWYACVQTTDTLLPTGSVRLCEPVVGQAVCGVFL